MAGRMGGFGRGKQTISFSAEQLGVSKGDSPVKQPTLHYPLLDHKPLPIELTTEMNYLVELRSNFAEHIQESLNNVQAVVVKQDVERFCENYEQITIQQEYNMMKHESKQDWDKMPSELKSFQTNKFNSRKRKYMDIEKKFLELEKKEKVKRIKVGNEEEKEEKDEEKEANEKEIGEEEEEEMDEEMDDGTDYANEYFETGEDYFSEDDNDDDPTY